MDITSIQIKTVKVEYDKGGRALLIITDTDEQVPLYDGQVLILGFIEPRTYIWERVAKIR